MEEKEEKKEEVEILDEVSPKVEEKKKNKNAVILIFAVLAGLVFMLLVLASIFFFIPMFNNNGNNTTKTGTNAKEVNSSYKMSGNSLEEFDLAFLKLENKGENKIYSPLSIKYALAMLSEASNGTTKNQIDAVIGNYKSKKYPNNEHMSFANAMFIRNTYKEQVKDSYTKTLADKYNAEVILDEFNNANNMNKWVSDKTFNLIGNLFDDDTVSKEDFILTNALAIDMNWNNQIHCATGSSVPCIKYGVRYRHEKYKTDYEYTDSTSYIYDENGYYPLTFNGKENIKSTSIKANFNRYDAVKEIGEQKIREEVGKAYKEWLASDEAKYFAGYEEYPTDVNAYLDKYIKELNDNYKQEAYSTDFMLYNDDSIKAFAKDLKEYDGTTLQYVGIMPKNDSLDKYIENTSAKDINNVISNLKEMKYENFKDGVVTIVKGYIPFFKYDYTLDLMNDLQKLGIKDVFDINKADLSNMLGKTGKAYISDASHKANIEFSNDGIKAAAATQMGGAGAAGGGFNYLYEIPVEEIDMTFDKPYMYIIRDKATGEVWFTGTVYEPTVRSVSKIDNYYYD